MSDATPVPAPTSDRRRRSRAAGTTLALAAGAVLAVGQAPVSAGTGATVVRAEGPTFVHDVRLSETDATVRAVTTADGRTIVSLHLRDVPTDLGGTTLGAHVHVGSCGADPLASGGHYQRPGTEPLHDREIWLDVDVNAGGNARSQAVTDWVVPAGAARSVVVHAEPTHHDTGAAGPRLFCVDVPFGQGS